MDIAVQTKGWQKEKAEVDTLLELCRVRQRHKGQTPRRRRSGADLQAAAGGERSGAEGAGLHRVRADAGDARGFPGKPGFSVATLNGSMDLDARDQGSAGVLARRARPDLDRCRRRRFEPAILPRHRQLRHAVESRCASNSASAAWTVSASRMWCARINFVLEDTVEHRVRQVLEEKLAVIAEEFGVDKASDVMDSVEAEPMFDELFVQGLQNPDAIESECDAVVSATSSTMAESRKSSELLCRCS